MKAAIFLHLAGPEVLEVFNTLSFDVPGDEKKLNKLIEKFEAQCIPRKNLTWERHVFNTRNQQPGETIDQYVTDLRSKAKTCEFGALTDSLIKDRLVGGVVSDKTRSCLLKQADLTLAGALDKAEKAVQTVKSLLCKAHAERKDYHLALLDFRNTPNIGSPAQHLMGQRTKTLLPTTQKLLIPKTIPPSSVKSGLLQQQSYQKCDTQNRYHP